jgi:site-specific DNA recombinase
VTTVATQQDTARNNSLPAVIYAAKSTEDRRGSIPTQIEDGRKLAEREGWRVIGVFKDEGFSAYTGNRGDELVAAEETAVAAAEEEGRCFIIGQHSDRIARGAGDAPDAADHLVEVIARWNRKRVTLATDQDDEFRDPRTNLRNAALQGQRNVDDSRRKSAATADGKKRTAERGEWPGGRVPDGYAKLPRGENEPRRLALDPERAAVQKHVLELGLRGLTSGEATRQLNAAGLLSRKVVKGGHVFEPWNPWRVRQTWQLPFYAGLATYKGEVVGEGEWPRIIEPEDWYRLQRICSERAAASENRARPGQRRSHHHLLAGLCECGKCGGPVHAIAGTKRADGSHPRRYHCGAARDVNGMCDAPRIDPEQVEAPFLAQLDALAVDLEGWAQQRTASLETDRAAVEKSLASAESEVADLESEEVRIKADYRRLLGAGKSTPAEVAASALDDVRREREQAEHRVGELGDVLAAAEDVEPVGDQVLDVYAELQAAIKGHVQGDTVAEVNARFREALSKVVLTPLADGTVKLRAYLSPAFMATVEAAPEVFAEAYSFNMGLPAEVEEGEVAITLNPPPLRAVEVQGVGAASPW